MEKSKIGRKQNASLIFSVAAFFFAAILLTGCLTYLVETFEADNTVTQQTEMYASEIAEEAEATMKAYPAYPWLLQYWYANADTMDIEYDALMNGKNRTAEKCRAFSQRHPDLQLSYLSVEQCEALPAEDQKLYAEIVYSWMLTRINEIKQSSDVDYLFCVISDEPFQKQFFVYSGAKHGVVRGTGSDDAYILGMTVDVSESQMVGMREATKNTANLANAGDYVDYYEYIDSFDGHGVFIGLTFSLTGLWKDISDSAISSTQRAVILQLILAMICLLLIIFVVVRPIKRMQSAIRSYSETKDSAAACAQLIQIKGPNELEHLSEDMADLTKEIDSYTNHIMQITSERERIETELNLANQIQAAMLPCDFPPYPDRNEFAIHASMEPAKEVGGDFYDFFLIDEDHLCMVIADVSGKGIPAALFMMASKIIISNHAKAGKTPAQILKAANEDICRNNTLEMFVTVWLGILEISTGKLTAANAGHEYPVWKRPGGEYEMIKDKHGFVIGGMEGIKYTEYELQLQPGTVLFVYTDGAPEATNAAREFFGTERMLEALNEGTDSAPDQVIRSVHSAVDAFVEDAEQFDDLTMLCLEYEGPTGYN